MIEAISLHGGKVVFEPQADGGMTILLNNADRNNYQSQLATLTAEEWDQAIMATRIPQVTYSGICADAVEAYMASFTPPKNVIDAGAESIAAQIEAGSPGPEWNK